ncbi:MAG: hypothetical protein Q9168_004485 [Polycauliona sp. 1 TL-2023]
MRAVRTEGMAYTVLSLGKYVVHDVEFLHQRDSKTDLFFVVRKAKPAIDIKCMLVDVLHVKNLGTPLDDVVLIDTNGIYPEQAFSVSHSGNKMNQSIIEVLLNFESLAVKCNVVQSM